MTCFNHQDGHTLHVHGAHLYVEEQGQPDGPALLMLHGGLGNLESFNPLAAHLGRHYRLIGIDSRGHGRSTLGSATLTYAQLQADVEAVLDHLQLSRVSLIGHSDGGIVGLRLAAAHVDRIDRLVTLGAHGALPAHDPTRTLYQNLTAARWRSLFPAQVEGYEALNPQPDFERLIDAVRRMWLDDTDTGYPEARVAGIRCPLLVVNGDQDRLVSRRCAFELVEQVQGARLLNLPFADHSVHENAPHALQPTLDDFLLAKAP